MIRPVTFGSVLVLAVLLYPLIGSAFSITLLNHIGIGALVALGLVLLTGVGGMMSFGQAAFVGISAYTTAWMSTALGLSPWLGLVFGLALTGVSALLIGAITLRLGGHFLSFSTIAWGISIYYLFGNLDALGRHTGLLNVPPASIGPISLQSSLAMYYLIWLVVAALTWFTINVLDSRPGRSMRLLRGGNQLMASVGMDAFQARLSAFVLAALFAGVAGWLYAHFTRFVSPTPFDVSFSIEYLLMAIIGGATQVLGAPIGSAVINLSKNALQDLLPHVTDNPGQIKQIVFSVFLILLLHHARGGLSPLLSRVIRQENRPIKLASAPLPRRELPPAGETILSVDGVSKRFGGLLAVNDVSFQINAGEIVGLIGPNGAGKSTLFNLITGVARADGGNIRFQGTEITKLPQRSVAALGCGRTFQHVKLRPGMSLLDNVVVGTHRRTSSGIIRSGLRLDRAEEESARAEAYRRLDQVGLADRAYDLAGNLPLGQQRVLEIARALASDPVLLILDEPAAGLRKKEKEALADMLKGLRVQGLTILVIEHDMDFVMRLVDRVVVLVFGQKLCEGSPDAVRIDPRVQEAYLGGNQ